MVLSKKSIFHYFSPKKPWGFRCRLCWTENKLVVFEKFDFEKRHKSIFNGFMEVSHCQISDAKLKIFSFPHLSYSTNLKTCLIAQAYNFDRGFSAFYFQTELIFFAASVFLALERLWCKNKNNYIFILHCFQRSTVSCSNLVQKKQACRWRDFGFQKTDKRQVWSHFFEFLHSQVFCARTRIDFSILSYSTGVNVPIKVIFHKKTVISFSFSSNMCRNIDSNHFWKNFGKFASSGFWSFNQKFDFFLLLSYASLRSLMQTSQKLWPVLTEQFGFEKQSKSVWKAFNGCIALSTLQCGGRKVCFLTPIILYKVEVANWDLFRKLTKSVGLENYGFE